MDIPNVAETSVSEPGTNYICKACPPIFKTLSPPTKRKKSSLCSKPREGGDGRLAGTGLSSQQWGDRGGRILSLGSAWALK